MRPVEVTHIGSLTTTGNSTPKSMGNIVVPRTGLVVVTAFVMGSSSARLTGISIGGSAATLEAYNTALTIKRGIGWRQVAAAGTLDVTISLSGSNGSNTLWHISAFLLENLKDTTPYLVSLPANFASNTTASVTLSSVKKGSFVAFGVGTSGTKTYSWSTATPVSSASESSNTAGYAYKAAAASGTHTETASWSGATTGAVIAAAWR